METKSKRDKRKKKIPKENTLLPKEVEEYW